MRTFTDTEKRFIGTASLIAFSFIFFAFFEQTNSLNSIVQGFIIATIFFFGLPLVYCRYVLDEPLSQLGIQSTQHVKAILWSVLSAFFGFLIVWGLGNIYPQIADQTVFPVLVESHFGWFVLYALFGIPVTLLVYEVFFRGMVQYLWLGNSWKAFGFQAVFFWLLLWLSEGISFSAIPLLITPILSGLVVKQTSSLWYAWLTSSLFIFLTDVLFLSLR
mgnify:FL=1